MYHRIVLPVVVVLRVIFILTFTLYVLQNFLDKKCIIAKNNTIFKN